MNGATEIKEPGACADAEFAAFERLVRRDQELAVYLRT